MQVKKDMKSYLLFSSSSILNLLKISSKILYLPSIIVYPSNICNYDCIMCECGRSKNKNPKTMDYPLIQKLLTECASFVFKPHIHFSGLGEPLVYPEIIQTMKLCQQKKLKWGMTTNGFLLEKYAEHFVVNNCKGINVSIHGKSTHQEKITRTKGAFEKVVRGLKKLDQIKRRYNKSSPLVAINCVLSNENIDNLKDILDTFLRLPINSVTFQHLLFSEIDFKNNQNYIIKNKDKLDELVDFIRYIEQKNLPIKVNFFPKIRKDDIPKYYSIDESYFQKNCILPWLSVRAYPNGDIKVCNVYFGNLNENTLKSIINSKKARSFRNSVKKGKFSAPFCFRCCHRHYY